MNVGIERGAGSAFCSLSIPRTDKSLLCLCCTKSELAETFAIIKKNSGYIVISIQENVTWHVSSVEVAGGVNIVN